jgi:hypothetical protein
LSTGKKIILAGLGFLVTTVTRGNQQIPGGILKQDLYFKLKNVYFWKVIVGGESGISDN